MLFCIKIFYKTRLNITVKYALSKVSIQHIMLNVVSLNVATLNVAAPQ
jgi:hypothetical protein